MFKDDNYHFEWKDIGNIEKGRPDLGPMVHVAVYRLMQFTLREALNKQFGATAANELLREAGRRAGEEFSKNILDSNQPLSTYLAQLQAKLLELKIGILRIEKSNPQALEFTLTVSEDLDCSGLPFVDETVCEYDEGFVAGLFEQFTGQKFNAREIDCWASGDRTCRFDVKVCAR
jgi:uncharacterized protein